MSTAISARTKLQGAVILGVGALVTVIGAFLSVLLASGMATGSRAPYALTVYGIALTWIGRRAYTRDEDTGDWFGRNPASTAALFTLAVLASIGVVNRIAG